MSSIQSNDKGLSLVPIKKETHGAPAAVLLLYEDGLALGWQEALHPRWPAGAANGLGGQWMEVGDIVDGAKGPEEHALKAFHDAAVRRFDAMFTQRQRYRDLQWVGQEKLDEARKQMDRASAEHMAAVAGLDAQGIDIPDGWEKKALEELASQYRAKIRAEGSPETTAKLHLLFEHDKKANEKITPQDVMRKTLMHRDAQGRPYGQSADPFERVQYFGTPSAFEVNDRLRMQAYGEPVDLPEWRTPVADSDIEAMREWMTHFYLDGDRTVYRGLSGEGTHLMGMPNFGEATGWPEDQPLPDDWFQQWADAVKGFKFVDAGFVSTTEDPSWAKNFTQMHSNKRGTPIVIRMHLPHGTNALDETQAYGDDSVHENEILLPPDRVFTITGGGRLPGNGPFVFDVEVSDGKDDPDYAVYAEFVALKRSIAYFGLVREAQANRNADDPVAADWEKVDDLDAKMEVLKKRLETMREMHPAIKLAEETGFWVLNLADVRTDTAPGGNPFHDKGGKFTTKLKAVPKRFITPEFLGEHLPGATDDQLQELFDALPAEATNRRQMIVAEKMRRLAEKTPEARAQRMRDGMGADGDAVKNAMDSILNLPTKRTGKVLPNDSGIPEVSYAHGYYDYSTNTAHVDGSSRMVESPARYWNTQMHEQLHGVSLASHSDFNSFQIMDHIDWEEATVEGATRAVRDQVMDQLRKAGHESEMMGEVDWSENDRHNVYSPMVDRLNEVADKAGIARPTFFRQLLAVPANDRQALVKELTNEAVNTEAMKQAGSSPLQDRERALSSGMVKPDKAADYATWYKTLTGKEKGAFSLMQGGHSYGTPDSFTAVKNLDDAIDRARTTHATTVYRGITLPKDQELTTFTDDGFVSTSGSRDFAGMWSSPRMSQHGADAKPVLLEIEVEPGTGLANVGMLNKKTRTAKYAEQEEFLLGRGHTFEVISKKGSDTFSTKGIDGASQGDFEAEVWRVRVKAMDKPPVPVGGYRDLGEWMDQLKDSRFKSEAQALETTSHSAERPGAEIIPSRHRLAHGWLTENLPILTDEQLKQVDEWVPQGRSNRRSAIEDEKAKRRLEDARFALSTDFRDATEADRKRLKIPPAWTDVKINPDPTAPLQAMGKDSKGRTQRRYSAEFLAENQAAKFERLRQFDPARESILAATEGDDSDTSMVVRLIALTGIRPGSTKDTGGEKKAYGATTLEKRHVKIVGNTVIMDFVGKEGVDNHFEVEDARIAEWLSGKWDTLGDEDKVFDSNDTKARDWMKANGGTGFLLKDFRTWLGTAHALEQVMSMEPPKTASEFRSMRKRVGEYVAGKLNNTATMALGAYINPSVFDQWRSV